MRPRVYSRTIIAFNLDHVEVKLAKSDPEDLNLHVAEMWRDGVHACGVRGTRIGRHRCHRSSRRVNDGGLCCHRFVCCENLKGFRRRRRSCREREARAGWDGERHRVLILKVVRTRDLVCKDTLEEEMDHEKRRCEGEIERRNQKKVTTRRNSLSCGDVCVSCNTGRLTTKKGQW